MLMNSSPWRCLPVEMTVSNLSTGTRTTSDVEYVLFIQLFESLTIPEGKKVV
jgi:hypothetical protein